MQCGNGAGKHGENLAAVSRGARAVTPVHGIVMDYEGSLAYDGARTYRPHPAILMTTPASAFDRRRAPTLVLALSFILGACGGEPRATTGDSAASVSPSAGTGASTTPDAPFAFTDADLDAYEKGMRKEIELVQTAKARGDSAKTPEERGAASQAAFESSTAPAAAQAVGAPLDRYQGTRRTVNRVFETLDFQGKIPGPMELDTARASPDMKQRLASDPFAELDPASATALRARLDALSKVWIEYMTLVAVAG